MLFLCDHMNSKPMTYKDIATVSGKGGLFKIIKPTPTGVILESLDDQRKKIVAGPHHKVSILDEISIYTTDAEGTVALKDVFAKIKAEFDDDPGLDRDSTQEEYQSFFAHILPEYDREKVYVSDMKKLVRWYRIINEQVPEMFGSSDEEGEES